MTASVTAVSPTDTESLLADTYAPQPERPYQLHTHLKKAEILELLNLNLETRELWPWLRNRGVTVRGIGHYTVSYGDLMKAGLVK